MLNELDEIKQYIGDVDCCHRLSSWFFLKKNRGGIPRALTIIARHYLFDEYHYDSLEDGLDGSDNSQKEIAREITKHILAAWCGFNYRKFLNDKATDDIEDTSVHKAEELIDQDKIEGWLPKYIRSHPFKENMSNSDYTYIENEIDSFITEYEQKWYVKSQKDIYQLINHRLSIDALNFYSIIADAIQAGPLVTRELYYDKESFEADYNMKPDMMERVIKIISAYLISLDGQVPDNQTVRLNNIDLANWMGYKPLGQGNHKEQLFNEKTSFITGYSDGLYVIDKDFLKKYSFRIEA